MAGNAAGVRKAAAARLGISFDEYNARTANGEKWCGICRRWQPIADFNVDRSRYDGLASKCRYSLDKGTVDRPGRRQREAKALVGLAWCRDCKQWLPCAEVSRGACRTHTRERARAYYAAHRAELCGRKVARARGLDPIPGWWRDQQFGDFGGLCAYGCGRSATSLDHVWPVAQGGKSEPCNLVPACKSCNSSKRDRDPWIWIDRGTAAFPEQWLDVIALNYEHVGPLEVPA